MNKRMKIVLTAILATFIIGIILFQNSKGIKAELLEVKPGTIAKTFKEEGKVVSQVERPIQLMYGGKIVELPVEEGQEVKQGDLLVKFDTKELDLQLEQFLAELKSLEGEEIKTYKEPHESSIKTQQLQVEQAQLDYESAKTNFDRIKLLFDEGAVTESELEDARKLLQSAENSLIQQKEALALLYELFDPDSGTKQYYAGRKDALDAQIKLIKYKIENSTITSPIDGVVSNLTFKKGEVVSPNSTLMTIFKKDSYEIQVYVMTRDAVGICPGMKVELIWEDEKDDTVFEGTVKKIAPYAVERISALGLEEQRVEVTIEPRTPKSIKLYPGYKLDIQFTTDKQEEKLIVPKTALFPYEEGDALWVVRDGRAEIQPVKKGFDNDRDVVIEEGLKNGELVVLNPQLEGINEGKRISKI
jgi:HlyD family secretion protein